MDKWGAGRYQPKTKLIKRLMNKTDISKVLFLREEYGDGQGAFVYSKRNKYEGNWKDGLRDGFGVHALPDRSKYVGQHKKGQ